MTIEIVYPKGLMRVDLEKFFPTSQKACKRLLAIIDMDRQHKDEIIQSIILWMAEERGLCEQLAKEYANKYVDIKQSIWEADAKVQRMEEYLDSVAAWKKTPEYKRFKKKFIEVQNEYRHLKSLESSYNSSFKRHLARKEKLQRNIEIMRGV